MDFNNDGILDMISGSYDPGDLYLFRGLGKGEYAAVEKIKDKTGLPLVHHPVELARYEKSQSQRKKDENSQGMEAESEESLNDRVASFGSWPEVVDWDGDGDRDMLIGSFRGEIYLRINEGTVDEPSFSSESILLKGAEGPIKVNGHAHPVAADWDRDGVWDLVVGSDIGAVYWYRNIGTASTPSFASAKVLIPEVAKKKFNDQILGPDDLPRQGVRVQICVTDYNADGWLDLIVGDYSDIKWTRKLSDEELAEKATDEAKITEMAAELKAMGYDKATEEKRQALSTEFFKLDDEMKKYFREVRRASFVWLYLRKPPAAHDSSSTNTSSSRKQPSKKSSDSADDKSASPVEFSAMLERDKADSSSVNLIVEAQIEDGWHLSAAADQGGMPVSIELKLPKGWEPDGEWTNPVGEPGDENPRSRYLKHNAVWKHKLRVPKSASRSESLKVSVHFQVCNDQFCRPPQTVEKTVVFEQE